MTRTIKRDIADIVAPNTLTNAGAAINRAQEIASGYSNSMEVFKKAIGHSALHEALERHTRLQTAIEGALPRTRLDSYYAAMNDALSFSAVNAFEEFTRRHNAIADSFTKYNNVFENIDTAANLAKKLISASSIKSVLGEDFDALTYSFEDLIPYPAATSAYDDLLREFSKHEDLVVEANNDEVISRQLDTIIEKLEASLPNDVSKPKSISETYQAIMRYMAILNFIACVVVPFAIYALQSRAAERQDTQAMQIEDKQLQALEAIKDIEDKQLQALEELVSKYNEAISDQAIIYKVKRKVPLCYEQRYCHSRLMWLQVNQEVEALDFDGKWVFVEAYDIASGETYHGWVLKKYMSRKTASVHIPTKSDDITDL